MGGGFNNTTKGSWDKVSLAQMEKEEEKIAKY